MVLAKQLLIQAQGTLQERLGLRIAALFGIEDGQIVEQIRKLRILLSRLLLPEVQRAPEERLGLS